MVINFTIEDLTDGMIVELKNGKAFYYFNGWFFSDEMLLSVRSGYNKELKNLAEGYNVQIVWKPEKTYRSIKYRNALEPYWERTEIKEITIAELEKQFGCKVKIVKDK